MRASSLTALITLLSQTQLVALYSTRIVAVAPTRGVEAVSAWVTRASSPEREAALRRAVQVLEYANGPNMACIALKRDARLTSIATIERIHSPEHHVLMLWMLECEDDTSGTVLMRSLVGTLGRRLRVAPDIHPRWRLAYAYFLPVAVE